jgi:hypothetical protein
MMIARCWGVDIAKVRVQKTNSRNCSILIADEDFRVGERGKAEGVDIRSMTEAAGVAQPAGTLQVR